MLYFDQGFSIIREPDYNYRFLKNLNESTIYNIKVVINFLIMLANIVFLITISLVTLAIVLAFLGKPNLLLRLLIWFYGTIYLPLKHLYYFF